MDILKAQNQSQINLVPYVSLKCLAAQVIMRERVPFTSEQVPKCMDELLQLHVPNLPAIDAIVLEESSTFES